MFFFWLFWLFFCFEIFKIIFLIFIIIGEIGVIYYIVVRDFFEKDWMLFFLSLNVDEIVFLKFIIEIFMWVCVSDVIFL